jgi:hypothetical protein
VSTPPTNREAEPRECLHCGSQLAGRYQRVRFIGGKAKRGGGAAAAVTAGSTRSGAA